MKKILFALLIISILFLFGCAPDRVSRITLTEREEDLVGLLAGEHYEYKYDADSSY